MRWGYWGGCAKWHRRIVSEVNEMRILRCLCHWGYSDRPQDSHLKWMRFTSDSTYSVSSSIHLWSLCHTQTSVSSSDSVRLWDELLRWISVFVTAQDLSSLISFTSDYPSLSLHTYLSILISFTSGLSVFVTQHIHLSILISFTSDTIRVNAQTSVASSHSLQILSVFVTPHRPQYPHLIHFRYYPSLSLSTSTSVASSHSLQTLSVFVTPHIHLSSLISFTSDTIRLCHSAHRPQ